MDFVIIGNPWHFGVDNPTSKHHIARMLAGMGHRVLWVDSTGMRTPRISSGADRSRIVEKVRLALRGIVSAEENIYVLSPLIFPFPQYAFFRWVNSLIYSSVIRYGAGRLGLKNPVLINFYLMIPAVMKRWRYRSVYYCVDRWEAFSRYHSRTMMMMNRQSCECADIVIASSQAIKDDVSEYNRSTHLVLHGVD